MTAGKAKGAAREYQILCRDVLQRRFGGAPYADDGIDVPFEVGFCLGSSTPGIRSAVPIPVKVASRLPVFSVKALATQARA